MNKFSTLGNDSTQVGKWNDCLMPHTIKVRLLILLMLLFTAASSFVYGQAGKNYQHWADGDAATSSAPEWNNNILNANKSDYFEGEVIPHVAIIPASNNTPLVQNTSYSFTVVYNYYQANTNAGGFAYITTYNISRPPTAFGGINPSLDPGGHTGTGSQGVFYVGPNVNVTNASAPQTTGTSTKDQTVTITFTWTGATTASGAAYIFYGLYISEPGKVPNQGAGTTRGAHFWTGGSLQTTLNSTFTGGLSLQLAPSAIIAGSISGVKFNDLDKDGIKDSGEPLLSGWTIQLDNDTDPTNGILGSTTTDANGAYSFSVTPDANKNSIGNDPYIVREVNQSGWEQTLPKNPAYYSVTITALSPTATNKDFGNFTCTNPTVTASIGNICAGTTSAALSYTVINSPTQYKIDWDDAALTDIAYTNNNLTASPINITVPAILASATYTGTITVKTNLGCESAGSPISLTVNANPVANAGTAPTAQCEALNGNTFNLSGSGSGGTPSWAVQSNPNNLTVVFNPNPPNSFTPSVKISGGTGSVTLRLTVTSGATPSCGTKTSDVTVTVNQSPTAEAGTAPAAQCRDASNGNTFNLSGSGTNGTPSWAVAPNGNPNNLTVAFNPTTPNTFTPSVTISGGIGSVTLRLTVTSASCGSATDDVTVTVNDKPGVPDASIEPVSCTDKTFSVRVKNSVVGVTYTTTQTTGYSSALDGTGDDLIFTGLTFGDGFSVVASIGESGCSSGAKTCGPTDNGLAPITLEPLSQQGNASSIKGSEIASTFKSTEVETVYARIEAAKNKVLAAPNPFYNKIKFTLQSEVSGQGSLEIYNMLGQKVKTVFQGYIQKGQVQNIEYNVPGAQRSNLIYIFKVGDQQVTGKLIGLK